ncbi:uncharacterized protein [Rutidosis leptorrhynchoides]|uniref:uncharacterized protein n=1 Tax=Rutidosis leptorrhynchoides TaxID=125765 RepID=UPI003A99F9CA
MTTTWIYPPNQGGMCYTQGHQILPPIVANINFWINQKTPFVLYIRICAFPDGMKKPSHLIYYEGKDDPDDFLSLFEGAARMAKWDIPVACHAFSYMLKGNARVWFDSIPKDSIASFDDLKRQFRSKFSQQKRHKKNLVAAHGIKQKDSEGSRAFLTRYTNETQQIPNLPESQRISGLLYGSRVRPLIEHLSQDLPSTYEALLEKAYIWLDAKETAGNFILDDTPMNRRKEKSERRDDKHGRKEDRGRFHPYRRETGAGILGALIKTPKEILATEKAANKFKSPGKMSNRGRNRDMTKFCDFHNDFGHNTDECFNLKIAIEEAVNSGKLSHLIKGIREPKKERVQEKKIEDMRQEAKNAILAIDSHQPYKKRERCRFVREWIEVPFPALDTICPSDLPVNINGKIFNREVRRIYLDSGSACDVMYERCFLRLSPAIRARLGAPRVPLVGFSGERCWPIGEIDLEFTTGEPPLARTETIDFVVV